MQTSAGVSCLALVQSMMFSFIQRFGVERCVALGWVLDGKLVKTSGFGAFGLAARCIDVVALVMFLVLSAAERRRHDRQPRCSGGACRRQVTPDPAI